MNDGPLNLLKLSVGTKSVDGLRRWQVGRMRATRRAAPFHVTRMVPRRLEELVDGGSIYWVIGGSVRCRQTIEAIEPFRDKGGTGRCRLVLGTELIETFWQPRRPFQGWRYLTVGDAPPDLPSGVDPESLELLGRLDALGLR